MTWAELRALAERNGIVLWEDAGGYGNPRVRPSVGMHWGGKTHLRLEMAADVPAAKRALCRAVEAIREAR